MREEKPEGQHSIRQIVNRAGDGSIICEDGVLTQDFVEQRIIRNKNTDNLTHVAGPQPAEQGGTFFRAATPRKMCRSTDADIKPA